ncbi:hypothetical protein ACOSQ2_005369 [Xanthoceras sorbifolium]
MTSVQFEPVPAGPPSANNLVLGDEIVAPEKGWAPLVRQNMTSPKLSDFRVGTSHVEDIVHGHIECNEEVLHENSAVYVFQAKEKEGTDVVIKSRAQPQHGVEMCSSSASSMRQSFVSQVVDSGEKISTAEKGKVVAILDSVDASSRKPMDIMPAGRRSSWKQCVRTSNDTRLVEMEDSGYLKMGASSEMQGHYVRLYIFEVVFLVETLSTHDRLERLRVSLGFSEKLRHCPAVMGWFDGRFTQSRGSVKVEAMRVFPGRLESHDVAMAPARDRTY